jgi:hypothetical protein
VAAKIVVIVENEDTCLRPPRAPVEPRGGEPADPAADHDEIVLLLGRHILDRESCPVPHEGMHRFERAGVLSAQPAQQRRITAGLCGNLCGRREPRRDAQRRPVDEIAPGD